MTKGSGRRRSKQQLGAEALTELKEGRATPQRPDWSDRRPLRFWQPFNDWWRKELDRLGRRPNAQEINGWYEVHAYDLWKEDAPSLQETRVHAKCLRSLPLVRDYFRNYRAKKRSVGEKVGPVRPRRRPRPDRKSGSFMSGDDQDYRDEGEEGDEGEGEAEEGEMEDDEDMSGGQDGDAQAHDGMDGDPDGVYAAAMGLDVEDFLSRDPTAAAAALAQLASIRGGPGGSPVAGLPLELLHPGVPSLQSLLAPSAAAALWSSAAAAQQAAVLDAAAAAQPAELLRSFTLQQLQHVAALQHQQQHQHQQFALAAIAQNLALSRASGMGLPGFTHAAAAAAAAMMPPQHAALLSVDEQQLVLEERFRADTAAAAAAAAAGACGVPGRDGAGYDRDDEGEEDDEDGGGGAVDFMEQVAQQAANLGRGKRRRGPGSGLLGWRQDYEMELHAGVGRELAGTGEGPTEAVGPPEPSGRGGGGGGGRRPGGGERGAGYAQQLGSKQRRTTKTVPAAGAGTAAAKQSTAAKRQSTATAAPLAARSESAEVTGAEGRGGREHGEVNDGEPAQGQGQAPSPEEERSGALSLVPLEALQVPAALGLEPVSREALTELSREELVERVLLLQAHLQLLVGQQQQLLLHHQHVETPPPAPERRTPQLAARQVQPQKGPQQKGSSSLRQPLQAGEKQDAAQEQGQQLLKQEELPTPMPTPARPDTSPGKVPTRAVSGSGSPVGGQRSGSPPGPDSAPHQQPQEPQPHPSTVRPQSVRGEHIYPTPVQRRGGEDGEVLNQAEAAAISVLAGLDAAPPPLALAAVFKDAAAAPARPSSSRRASEGVGRSSARPGSDGERGLPEPAAVAEVAGA